jgi:L-glyceraldehyde 3-phosphate reductase
LRSGKALYVGISSYNAKRTEEANALLKEFGQRCLIHQPTYSMLNRWVETEGLLNTLDDQEMGCIVFSAMADGLLTNKYLGDDPGESSGQPRTAFSSDLLTPENLADLRALNDIAVNRQQTLSQMALAWVLRNPRVTSVLIGANNISRIEESVGALGNLNFTPQELTRIDFHANSGGFSM